MKNKQESNTNEGSYRVLQSEMRCQFQIRVTTNQTNESQNQNDDKDSDYQLVNGGSGNNSRENIDPS